MEVYDRETESWQVIKWKNEEVIMQRELKVGKPVLFGFFYVCYAASYTGICITGGTEAAGPDSPCRPRGMEAGGCRADPKSAGKALSKVLYPEYGDNE